MRIRAGFVAAVGIAAVIGMTASGAAAARQRPDAAVTVVVVDPDGKPLAGRETIVSVAWASK